MNPRPPVQPLRESLPFHDSAFGWDTFEDFFCDFLNAQPVIVLNDNGTEIRQRVIRARPFGRKGDSQHGIDLVAEMEGGEVWDFQCKHYKTWGPERTSGAIDDYERDAPRRFLLVTRDVSEECHNIVGANPGWSLWDAREINRRFRELKASKAAPILFTHFGPGWAEAFFGISGDGPLIGAEAKFERFLRPNIRFHHRHALVGRTALVEQLDAFIHDEKARVFILTGRGGLGKSRLLLHWSREFNSRHPNHTLRFLSDKCADFGPSLQVAPQPLTIAFDDAHRFDDIRRSLFHELPRRENIKLVLSLRPGPNGQVVQELLGAGFDTTEITTSKPIKSLTSAQAMELVDAALKPQFFKHRQFLRAASRDCPLIAVIGAELINSGTLTSGDLLDEKELQRRVFESLLDDANPVREKFGAQQTDDFLRLLALLGPVKLDSAFFAKAAPFVALPNADRVSHLRDALDAVGLLHTTGAGTRVTPDLLSDHLAYTACYDHAGQSRTFAERLLEHFSPDEFPKLMQHLAEAEWRATDEKPDAASVVEPLWQWFRARFERSPFHERSAQIQEWANIAHLQPRRSLELAEFAVSLTTAPPTGNEWMVGFGWDNHSHLLDSLPAMLKGVAEHHPEYVSRCFDLLWQLGRDKPSPSSNDKGHPISVISEVVAFKHWKSLHICDSALAWFERVLAGDEARHYMYKPGWLFSSFLEPIFATSVEENWSTGHTFHMRSLLISLPNTAQFRQRVLAMCRKVLTLRDVHLANQLIPVLRSGCDIARLSFSGSPPKEFNDEWEIERLKALAVLEEMAREFVEPIIHFQIRQVLMHHIRYDKDSPAFRGACGKVVASIPDTLDFRIARSTFGNCYDEFERGIEDPNWQTVAKARWATFIHSVADEIHAAYSSADAWLRHFATLDLQWRSFDGFQPNFRHLIIAFVERWPAEGISAAEILLAEPTHPLAHAFDALVLSATKLDVAARLRLIRSGAESQTEILQVAALACCTWWRREGKLPEGAWQIIEELAPNVSSRVANEIVNFVWLNDNTATIRDWHLITSLPFLPENSDLAGHIAKHAAELICNSGLKPDSESADRFLARFESLISTEGENLKRGFQKLAKAFPVAMFLMLWRRNRARIAGQPLKQLPYDLSHIEFQRVMSDPEVEALVSDCDRRFTEGEELDYDEMRLLRSVIRYGHDDPSAWLEAAVNRANSEDHLDALRELGTVGSFDNAALAYPSFVRALLVRARAINPKCHERMFSSLLHVGGCRGSTSGEPDPEWKGLLQTIERFAAEHADDSELGPLFAAIETHERSRLEHGRMRWAVEEEME